MTNLPVFDPKPVTLSGRFIRLEPLTLAHVTGLCRVGFDPDIWTYMLYGQISDEEGMRAFVNDLLQRQQHGSDLPFVVIDRAADAPIGCTRYLDIQRQHRGLEIGGTWYGADYRRTAVNSEAKYLLLSHAFETLGALRVQFKTDLGNTRSQIAIERLGAQREGILRDHMIRPDGTLRSSVYYSVLAAEWPEVKARLEGFLAR